MAEELGQSPTNIELKAIVAEASRALAALDALRLEEMALSCEVLNRAFAAEAGANGRKEMARQAREAAADMEVFSRVLEATSANLRVMNRLREMRGGLLEYTARGEAGWKGVGAESGDGND